MSEYRPADVIAVGGDLYQLAIGIGVRPGTFIAGIVPEEDASEVIHALQQREARIRASVESDRRTVLIEAQREAEPWMEPLARRLWGHHGWAWHLTDLNRREHAEIIAAGPVRYSAASLQAERRFGDGSSGPPAITMFWPEWHMLSAYGRPTPGGRGWNDPDEWATVRDSYSRDDAAARLETAYRSHLDQFAAQLPPERRREARATRERREIARHFTAILTPVSAPTTPTAPPGPPRTGTDPR